MKIYLIYVSGVGYDSYNAHVIVANNEKEVIELAKKQSADEGEDVWNTAKISDQGVYMGVEVDKFILLSSFNAG